MTYYNRPHTIDDPQKLKNMIDALEAGQDLPPVVVCGYEAITGSHRLEAWAAVGQEAKVVELSEAEYAKTCQSLFGEVVTIDEIYDLNEFCSELYKITADQRIKKAIKDQR